MKKADLGIVVLSTVLGAEIGGFTDSCISEERCWEASTYEKDPACQEAPLPPLCVAKEIGKVLNELPKPATENPQGAAVGGALGLFSGALLLALAGHLDRKRG